ncbi:DUF721 domain-containing protein [Cellulophaga sp. F20128]|uniref:DUF721 domain-containing protein n=1 Tax=Cellulophaga sp. F20128 TaxID=2926413 RepID=UPI001FF6BFBC|nr:DUF721 domain-containing protein [Cellulophaga sp. F20128]MCK0157621.1 DUF721 domain-containing protein [Cellulophaga sp. F20128]
MAKRKNENLPLGAVLQDFIKENRLERGINVVDTRLAWKNLMGAGVNNYTSAVELRNGTLFVSLTSSVLREELSHGISKIIKMINEDLGKEVVTKLVLR